MVVSGRIRIWREGNKFISKTELVKPGHEGIACYLMYSAYKSRLMLLVLNSFYQVPF